MYMMLIEEIRWPATLNRRGVTGPSSAFDLQSPRVRGTHVECRISDSQ